MVGKRAKILSPDHIEDLLVFARQTRYPTRNQALVLLSVKAGLRAGEIANLTWPMLAEPTGEIASSLELQDRAAKKRSGRVIPIHPELRAALIKLARPNQVLDGPVIRSERGGPMTSIGIVCWFANAFRSIGLCNDGACKASGSASSAALFGPSASLSANPSFAAMCTTLATAPPVPIWINCTCGGRDGGTP
jgi:integrase